MGTNFRISQRFNKKEGFTTHEKMSMYLRSNSTISSANKEKNRSSLQVDNVKSRLLSINHDRGSIK